MKKNILKQVGESVASRTNVPVNLLTSDLDLASVLSKLVPDTRSRSRAQQINKYGPDQSALRSIAQETAGRISDARNFLQLLPDLKMAFDILISSVLSPKDMMETTITYASETDTLPTHVLANLNSLAHDFFDKDYNITPQLPRILEDILAITGSYPVAVLPENSIDEVINGGRYSLESFREWGDESAYAPLGILGSADTVVDKPRRLNFSLESYTGMREANHATAEMVNRTKDGKVHSLFISVNDNPNLLRRPSITEALQRAARQRSLGYGRAMESALYSHIPNNINIPVYKSEQYGSRPMIALKTQEQLSRHSAGKPIKMHLPSESVIPVFSPGDPESHLGYFCLLDENCYPLTLANGTDYYGELKAGMADHTKDANSALVQRMSAQFGFNQSSGPNLDNIIEAYSSMIEADLNQRLRNGLAGGEVKIANRDALIYMMFARYCRQQYTQILYLPRELLNYMAIDFNEYGVGKSLIEDMRVILGLRVVLTFANTMASVRNSINRTQVNVKFDEFDADPWKTLEQVMGELNRTRSGMAGNLPIGASGPAEVVEWLARAGYEFTFEGHPAMPDLKLDFNEKTTNYQKVDTELDDEMRKRSLMGVGVQPEAVDNAFSPDFAKTVTSNNLLLAKRVIWIQERFEPILAEHCRTIMMNDAGFLHDIRSNIEENLDSIIERMISKREYDGLTEETEITDEIRKAVADVCLTDFVRNFHVSLPRPNSLELENQIEAFKTYMDALNMGIEQFVDSAFANSDTMGELGGHADILKSAISSMFARRYMAENKFMSELFELVTSDESGKPNLDMLEECSNHVNSLTKSTANFIKNIQLTKAAGDKLMERLGAEEASGGGSDTGGEGNEDDTGGGGDDYEFDFEDDNLGSEETTESEGESTEETSESTGETGGESDESGEAEPETNGEA